MVPAVGEEGGAATADVSRRTFRFGCAAILLFAALIRVWGLDQVPAGLFCDEAGNGYNAFSLLESGRDEEGSRFPLYIWSFGVSYKNPVFIYSAIPVVAALGLSEFSIRLTAALWGILGVASILWLGSILFGRRGGLWSGFTLAICPWHVHFSRVAFELIALLPFFAGGFACFLLGVRGRPRWLIAAGVLFAGSLYAYAPAKLFVPLFVAGAVVLYLRRLIAAGRWAWAGLGAAVLTGLPVVIFDLMHRQRSGQYFSETTIFDPSRPVESIAAVAANWASFFTPDFLFFSGDPLIRHSVPGVGQLYFAMAPLILIGMVWTLRRRRPEGKLLLWWLLLYPIAPSLMNEVPSASRGFIGAGVYCLLAAAGATALSGTLLAGGRRGVRGWLHDISICAVVALLLVEAGRYGYRYATVYPAAAAEAFQYGYKQALALMEPERGNYDTLLMTTTDGNQAQIFALFYNQYDPDKWLEAFDPGYLIIDPAEFDRYDPEKERVLAALRDSDLALFDEVEVRGHVTDPSGRTVFTIAEIEKRGFYLRDWLLLGTFDNATGAALRTDVYPHFVPTLDAYRVGDELKYWRRILPFFVRVELHNFYRSAIEPSGRDPVWVCAYATTELVADHAMEVGLEIDGPTQWVQGWLDGQALAPRMTQIGQRRAEWVLRLDRGRNQLLLETCRGQADWSFTARVRGADGRPPVGLTSRARIGVEPLPATSSGAPRQLVDGFAKITAFSHVQEGDGDYRGPSVGWVEYLYDPDGAVEWETAPLPEAVATAVAFTAVLSPVPGTAQLWVDGRFALAFDTGRFTSPRQWSRDGYRLRYFPRESGDYRSGYWVLWVSAEHVRAGVPLRLRVSHIDGGRDASFMLKGRADTVEYERLTRSSLADDTG